MILSKINKSSILYLSNKYIQYKLYIEKGITVEKLIKSGYGESSAKHALFNLVEKGYMTKVKDGREYRYFKTF